MDPVQQTDSHHLLMLPALPTFLIVEYLPIGTLLRASEVIGLVHYTDKHIPPIEEGELFRSIQFIAQTRCLLVEVERVELVQNGWKSMEVRKKEGLRTLIMKLMVSEEATALLTLEQ